MPVLVDTELSRATVTPLPEAVDVIPVPPSMLKVSESKSILIAVVPSVKSRS